MTSRSELVFSFVVLFCVTTLLLVSIRWLRLLRHAGSPTIKETLQKLEILCRQWLGLRVIRPGAALFALQ